MFKLSKIKVGHILLFLFLFLFLGYFVFQSKDYEENYFIGNVSITETFKKEKKLYQFSFKVNDLEFFTLVNHKYMHSKKIIQNITIKQKEDITCLLIESKGLFLYPLCQENGEPISYTLIEDEELIPSSYKSNLSSQEKDFKSLKLYSLYDQKYYLWNYTGFYVITKDSTKEIKIFNNDYYNIPLTAMVGNYLVIANYDEKYNFSKFYVIDTIKDKVRELKLEEEISYNSYFLGTYANQLYLMDRKNRVEYEINPKKLKIDSVTKQEQGIILNEDEWETVGMQSLVSNEKKFTHKLLTSYKIENGILYKVQENYKTKISNQNVKEIVLYNENFVYYLVEDNLYAYNDKDGEKLVINNFEWNFNYQNMIYIF